MFRMFLTPDIYGYIGGLADFLEAYSVNSGVIAGLPIDALAGNGDIGLSVTDSFSGLTVVEAFLVLVVDASACAYSESVA